MARARPGCIGDVIAKRPKVGGIASPVRNATESRHRKIHRAQTGVSWLLSSLASLLRDFGDVDVGVAAAVRAEVEPSVVDREVWIRIERGRIVHFTQRSDLREGKPW